MNKSLSPEDYERRRAEKKPTWFAHVCHFCGLKSKEVDFIVGDGVYQCWFINRDECEIRHEALSPVEFARLPKSGSDPRADWSPQARARSAEIEEMLAKLRGPADPAEII